MDDLYSEIEQTLLSKVDTEQDISENSDSSKQSGEQRILRNIRWKISSNKKAWQNYTGVCIFRRQGIEKKKVTVQNMNERSLQ